MQVEISHKAARSFVTDLVITRLEHEILTHCFTQLFALVVLVEAEIEYGKNFQDFSGHAPSWKVRLKKSVSGCPKL